MKKKITLVFCLLLLLACTAFAAVPSKPSSFAYAYDLDGSVLDSGDMETIARYGEALKEATGVQAVAVVTTFLDGMDPADYCADLINQWGIGDKSRDDGIVVLLARGDRKIQIGTGKGIDRTLTAAICGNLIDQNIDYFADGKYAEGVVSLYSDVCKKMASLQGKKLSVSTNGYETDPGYEPAWNSFYLHHRVRRI